MTQVTGSITLPALTGIATATALVGTGSISGTMDVGQTITATWPTLSGQTASRAAVWWRVHTRGISTGFGLW